MGNGEDYLDSLLHNMKQSTGGHSSPLESEEDFLREFDEIVEDGDDEFLRNFEAELNAQALAREQLLAAGTKAAPPEKKAEEESPLEESFLPEEHEAGGGMPNLSDLLMEAEDDGEDSAQEEKEFSLEDLLTEAEESMAAGGSQMEEYSGRMPDLSDLLMEADEGSGDSAPEEEGFSLEDLLAEAADSMTVGDSQPEEEDGGMPDLLMEADEGSGDFAQEEEDGGMPGLSDLLMDAEESGEEPAQEDSEGEDEAFLDKLNEIITGAEEDSADSAPEEDFGLEFGDDEPDGEEDSQEDGESGTEDILNLLDQMSEDEDLSDIGDMLKKEADDAPLEDMGEEYPFELEDMEEDSPEEDPDGEEPDSQEQAKGKKKKEKKKKEKTGGGLLAKILAWLNSDDDEDEADLGLKSVSEENKDILDEIGREEKKADKKKLKKEKKAKEKKPKKEKAPKAKKPKKEKPPKEPKEPEPPQPPLPKLKVFLIFFLSASFVLMLVLGMNLFGYSLQLTQSAENLGNGSYKEAYMDLLGITVKEANKQEYDRVRVISILGQEYETYVSYMKVSIYPEALNALIKGIERYDKYYEEAKSLGVDGHYDELKARIEEALMQEFGLTADQARELKKIEDRGEYSRQIYAITDSKN